MKNILFVCMTLVLLSFVVPSTSTNLKMKAETIYQFKVPALDGGTIDFSTFKGKYILVVNTASKCGYTPQYADLEKLYKEHGNKLVIVGFPANASSETDDAPARLIIISAAAYNKSILSTNAIT